MPNGWTSGPKLLYTEDGELDYTATLTKVWLRFVDPHGEWEKDQLGPRPPYDWKGWNPEVAWSQARTIVNGWIAEAMGDIPSCKICGGATTTEFYFKTSPHFHTRCTKCEAEWNDMQRGLQLDNYEAGFIPSDRDFVIEMAKHMGSFFASELVGEDLEGWVRR